MLGRVRASLCRRIKDGCELRQKSDVCKHGIRRLGGHSCVHGLSGRTGRTRGTIGKLRAVVRELRSRVFGSGSRLRRVSGRLTSNGVTLRRCGFRGTSVRGRVSRCRSGLRSGTSGLRAGRRRLGGLARSLRGTNSMVRPFEGCGVSFSPPYVSKGCPLFVASG